jgi:hypothetical protein
VGARIPFNIAQIWRASTPDDAKLLRAVSTPGLLSEMEGALGPYPSGYAYEVQDDERKAAFSAWLLERKRPRLHLCYFSGLDEVSHETGPGSKETLAVLERLDAVIGRVRAAAERAGGGAAILAVVSDHGHARTERELHLNEALREEGLLLLDGRGKITSWRAIAWEAGGSAAIVLHDPADADARTRVERVLERLRSDPEAGIDRVIDAGAARGAGGFGDVAWVVGLRPGTRLGGELQGAVVRDGAARGTHGYFPEHADMDAAFFIAGPGVPAGLDLGRIDMRDIAPTLAGRLRVRLPAAEGRDRLSAR